MNARNGAIPVPRPEITIGSSGFACSFTTDEHTDMDSFWPTFTPDRKRLAWPMRYLPLRVVQSCTTTSRWMLVEFIFMLDVIE